MGKQPPSETAYCVEIVAGMAWLGLPVGLYAVFDPDGIEDIVAVWRTGSEAPIITRLDTVQTPAWALSGKKASLMIERGVGGRVALFRRFVSRVDRLMRVDEEARCLVVATLAWAVVGSTANAHAVPR